MEVAAPKEKKRALSSNTTGLRFMQRSDAAPVVDPMANLVSARAGVATVGGVAKRRIVVTDSIALLDGDVGVGRYSARGFNAEIEKTQRAGQRAAVRAEEVAQRAEVEAARKRQADIPDDEMAKRLRTFTGGAIAVSDDEGDESAGVSTGPPSSAASPTSDRPGDQDDSPRKKKKKKKQKKVAQE